MNIRRATIDDASAISEQVSKLTTLYVAPSLSDGGLEKMLASMDVASTLQRIQEDWPHLCAFDGDRLVGVIVVKPPTHLYHLFVHSDFHRTGIARKLFTLADKLVFNRNQCRLATVNASLNAVVVYERFGFAVAGPITQTDGVRYQPMVRQCAG